MVVCFIGILSECFIFRRESEGSGGQWQLKEPTQGAQLHPKSDTLLPQCHWQKESRKWGRKG